MSDDQTQIIQQVDEREKFINRLQRFFEDWWPLMLFLAIIGAILFTTFTAGDNGDAYQFCREAHGHLVRTGVDDQLACVDANWKLVTP